MFVSTSDYIGRICHTLEHVIAPDLESDFARSQVFAVIALLGSLDIKIAYKTELILGEINAGMEIIGAIADALKGENIDVPDEVLNFLKEAKENPPAADINAVNQVNAQFRCILDFLYAGKKKINPDVFDDLDVKIRKYIHDISFRDVGFMPPMTFDKILKSGKEDK